MEDKTIEKRRFPRIGFRIPVSFHIRGTSQQLATLSRNISEGGMGLSTDQFLAPESLISLEFSLLQRFFTLYARTKWIASVPSSENYHFGLEFLEIQPEDREDISDFIKLKMQGATL